MCLQDGKWKTILGRWAHLYRWQNKLIHVAMWPLLDHLFTSFLGEVWGRLYLPYFVMLKHLEDSRRLIGIKRKEVGMPVRRDGKTRIEHYL